MKRKIDAKVIDVYADTMIYLPFRVRGSKTTAFRRIIFQAAASPLLPFLSALAARS